MQGSEPQDDNKSKRQSQATLHHKKKVYIAPIFDLCLSLSSKMVLATSHSGKDGAHDDPAVDFRGNPVDKSRTGGWLAAGLILVTELSERICIMGISMNLVTYLVGELHISSAKSATIVTNFMGTLNLLGLLGGFLADAKLGRYLTVAIFASITALGIGLLTTATTIPSMRPPQCDDYRKQQHQCIEASGSQLALLYAALYTTALGGGGIKSNVSGFGSDQFDQTDPKEEKAMLFFFNSRDNGDRSSSIALWDTVVPFQAASSATVPHTEKFKCLDKAAIMDDPTSISAQKNNPFKVSTVMEVEEVKMVLKLIPIWSTCILFWTVYSQMTTFTVEQATFMNRKVGSLVIPSAHRQCTRADEPSKDWNWTLSLNTSHDDCCRH
ncbi:OLIGOPEPTIDE TRANSPORTER-RELATED [Salix koriyanagi]|uniref:OLIGOPEPTIDE TRANSPORTER-RELATED n=1 Tax=Salix koriyanagi TaxID=2511006 RepID=A0A9Q0U5I8_9ROSI|nr:OLIGOPEPTIDE TRANSPORTER-RELATED [Salix koriyanagi]